jgi:hypothetical protein
MHHDAQFAIVTDPANPNKPPVVNPDAPVNLDVHLIKAYPKHLAEVSYSLNNTVSVANYWRVKIFKDFAYVGIGVDVKTGVNGQVSPKVGIIIPY